MKISTKRLDALATRLTGKRTRVAIGHDLPMGLHGAARWSDEHKCHEILLSPWILQNQHNADLCDLFLHEAAHIALNHIQPGVKSAAARELTPAMLEQIAATSAACEAAADELARHLAYDTGLTSAALWQLMREGE